ncbi:hypothetical protein N7490_003210 [Penicillium lividum]|nr:hypothetical protein N7490_003210 [Penicillium lividum]
MLLKPTFLNQIQFHQLDHTADDKLLMPIFSATGELTSRRLQNEWDSPSGPEFARSYNEKLFSTARPARSSEQANLFPNRLVGPDGVTFKTTLPCPNYIVISYTWGRWKLRTREQDTDVRGGHWKVPANKLFSREDLESAVRKIANGRAAWVDVLCIPQIDDDIEHSMEIGKQGEIFRSASHAAIWLCSGGDQTLAEICSWVPEESYMEKPQVLPIPDLWDRRHGTVDFTEARRRLNLIVSLTSDVPWTTSLWTLQEAALRLDAIFYDKKGDPILHRQTGNPLTVRHLVKTMTHIWDALARISEPCNELSILDYTDEMKATTSDVDLWFKAVDAVNQINLHNLISMNAGQLLLTSTHRTCKRPHDRVYGIMGAIGISIPVDYKRDPSEVMDMFLVELHNEFPAEIQAFIPESLMRLKTRTWLADEDCNELGVIRQLKAPPIRPFSGITSTDELIVNQIIHISHQGLDDLKMRFLSETVVPAFDNNAFSEISNGSVLAETAVQHQDTSPKLDYFDGWGS